MSNFDMRVVLSFSVEGMDYANKILNPLIQNQTVRWYSVSIQKSIEKPLVMEVTVCVPMMVVAFYHDKTKRRRLFELLHMAFTNREPALNKEYSFTYEQMSKALKHFLASPANEPS